MKRVFYVTLLFITIFSPLLCTAYSPQTESPMRNLTGRYTDYLSSSVSIAVWEDENHGSIAAEVRESLDYTDFIGRTFAVKIGVLYDEIVRELMNPSNVLLFEDYPSIYEAVQKGRADAGMRGAAAARASLLDSAYFDLALITLPEYIQSNPLGAISMDQDMIDELNAFLAFVKTDGIYDEMTARWCEAFEPGNIPAMPEILLTGENGMLTVVTSSDYMPFSFLGDNGMRLGFDIEFATRFAAHMGMDIAFIDMPFSGILPYIISSKADFAMASIIITDERKESVLFTESYYNDLAAIIYRKDTGFPEESAMRGGLIEWLKTGVQRNLITDNRWKMIADGLVVTMVIAVFAQLFGTALGCFICWLLMQRNRFAKWIGNLYCGLIHGTPIVVLLMITYYIIFGNTQISNIIVAIAAFTMVTGAGIADNLKGAIETVDPIEIEAAQSLGFSSFQAFLAITLPQAIKRALPSYTNGFVELVKATAIVGYIAVQDLTRAADIIRSRTYDAYFPVLLVAGIYLIVTTICIQLFKLALKK